mmetsp:Transcript_17508/g.27987  ORF Transcript_17508/g.27987 Transcript_17508/m.27987 type:complete len:80 (-) Transcript_17508:220-459(-)
MAKGLSVSSIPPSILPRVLPATTSPVGRTTVVLEVLDRKFVAARDSMQQKAGILLLAGAVWTTLSHPLTFSKEDHHDDG